MTKVKLKIINRQRFTTFVTMVFILLSIATITLIDQKQVNGQSQNSYKYVPIVTGDTLWDIAKENNHNNEDIRNVIYDIMNENDMTTAMLYKDQVIKVPVK
ncbi:LysM peptidoglycan-binding domain-containing protein [Petroclostridium sp. X23]|uniref:LysM peptidoglycan-binding domain-containing protein n=1 Tax=Petroclostridium sp. X23 TaxID=3045146 RepID=UPI0024AE492F|nr:LysM peptidoglycan-binding domain-containing protein [Petroclostridium sp. X23]WHH59513.1 LysM peptidoglycan-binding domain-containing protein [Petroclostridium sp. X23]